MEVISVTIKDAKGRTYSRNWAITANKLDAIRWTITSEDVRHYVDVNEIEEVTVRNSVEGGSADE